MKTFQIRNSYNPWLSQQTKDMMLERDRLQKGAAETNDQEVWKEYKKLRNKINNRLKSEEKDWQRSKLSECSHDSGLVWKTIKGILSWTSSGSPSQLFHNGALWTKPQEVASVQNEYFLDKVRQIRENLPPPVSDPLAKLRHLMSGRKCSFKLTAVHPDEVDKIISSLKNSNSFGLDLIDTQVVKLIKAEILPALTHVINLSIDSREFPAYWKRAKVIPLHKKEDLLNPKNFRPVAILPIFSKVLERAVFNQIIYYLSENNLLHPNHHAYRTDHNTTTALIQMYDAWMDSLNEGQISGVCLLDMSAAFDIVDHSLLLEKLKLYGFQLECLDWIKSYLTDRTQCVSINGSLSRLLPVPTGVPQGSILGPVFYTIFTNELPELVHDHHDEDAQQAHSAWPPYNMKCMSCGNVCCFADDTTYSCSDDDPSSLSDKLSSKFKVLSDFLISNRLKLNDDKTHLMVLTTSQKRKKRGPDLGVAGGVVISTPSTTVSSTSAERLLGGWIHQDLKWAEHIQDNDESLIRSLTTRLSALKIVGKVASFKTRKMIANGIFISKLSYLISLWGGCEGYLLQSLQIVQNKAARAVTKLDWNTSTQVLLSQCGWLSVRQLAMYHTVVLVYKVLQNRAPRYLHGMFSRNYLVKTRLADKELLKPSDADSPTLELIKNSFRWRAMEQYNLLTLEIRNSPSITKFKVLAKKWIIENIPVV